tara:strand:+ start:1666 stop:2127 length:462 start_codon:yes stop_codon:yes gene_type:complete
MSELEEYISNLEGLSNNLEEILYATVKKNQGKILTMVKLRLFNKGVDGSGSLISPKYAPDTIFRKKKKLLRTSHVTLRHSGKLYKSFIVEFKNNNIFIATNVGYKQDLIDQYGLDIFNLTLNEIRTILYSFFEPEIQKELNKVQNIDLTDEVL